MSKTLDELRADLDAAREAHQITGAVVTQAYDAWKAEQERQIEEAVSGNDFDVALVIKHAPNLTAAHKALKAKVKELGFYDSGYYGTYDEPYSRIAPKFLPEKDADMAEGEKSLRAFYRLFDGYVADSDGTVLADFMENTLSEGGVYMLRIEKYGTPDEKTVLQKTTYGHTRDLREGSLIDILTHVQNHHWYGEPYPDDEDY